MEANYGRMIESVDEIDDAARCYSCAKLFLPPLKARSNRHEMLCPECNVDDDHAEATDEDFSRWIVDRDHEVALRYDARFRRVPAAEIPYDAIVRAV